MKNLSILSIFYFLASAMAHGQSIVLKNGTDVYVRKGEHKSISLNKNCGVTLNSGGKVHRDKNGNFHFYIRHTSSTHFECNSSGNIDVKIDGVWLKMVGGEVIVQNSKIISSGGSTIYGESKLSNDTLYIIGKYTLIKSSVKSNPNEISDLKQKLKEQSDSLVQLESASQGEIDRLQNELDKTRNQLNRFKSERPSQAVISSSGFSTLLGPEYMFDLGNEESEASAGLKGIFEYRIHYLFSLGVMFTVHEDFQRAGATLRFDLTNPIEFYLLGKKSRNFNWSVHGDIMQTSQDDLESFFVIGAGLSMDYFFGESPIFISTDLGGSVEDRNFFGHIGVLLGWEI